MSCPRIGFVVSWVSSVRVWPWDSGSTWSASLGSTATATSAPPTNSRSPTTFLPARRSPVHDRHSTPPTPTPGGNCERNSGSVRRHGRSSGGSDAIPPPTSRTWRLWPASQACRHSFFARSSQNCRTSTRYPSRYLASRHGGLRGLLAGAVHRRPSLCHPWEPRYTRNLEVARRLGRSGGCRGRG